MKGHLESVGSLALELPTLPLPARKASVFKQMRKPLVYVPVLVDSDCTVLFDKHGVIVSNPDGKTVLQGDCDAKTGLWLVPITNEVMQSQRAKMGRSRKQCPHSLRSSLQLQSQPPSVNKHQANNSYTQRTLPCLAAYLHAYIGYIPPKTCIRTINNCWFVTWPGLTSKMIAKHLPKYIPTTMGRLHMTRKNVRSTTLRPEGTVKPEMFKSEATDYAKTRHVGVAGVLSTDQMVGVASTDLKGRFPITSAQDNAYVFGMHDYDSRAIMDAPIKNRKKESLIADLDQCLDTLRKVVIKPVLLRLDNEVSKDMISHIMEDNMTYQLASPGNHRLFPVKQ